MDKNGGIDWSGLRPPTTNPSAEHLANLLERLMIHAKEDNVHLTMEGATFTYSGTFKTASLRVDRISVVPMDSVAKDVSTEPPVDIALWPGVKPE